MIVDNRYPLKGMSSDEIVTACEENYADYWRSATRASKTEWSESGGITRCVTGLPQEIFNVVLYCRLGKTDYKRRIDEAIDEFKSRRIPLIWHVGRTTSPPEVAQYLQACGHPKDYELVAMAAHSENAVLAESAFARIQVRRCETNEDYESWISCLAESWDSPEPVGSWMRANPFFCEEQSHRTLYLGLIDSRPCGAVMLLTSRGIAGLQCVGTIKSAQKKGVGLALVKTAMGDAAAEGYGFVVVLSTTEGVPLYRKAGFEPYGVLPEHGMYFDKLSP